MTQSANPAQDMRARFRPSDEQHVAAMQYMSEHSEILDVIVGLALPDKQYGLWMVGQNVCHVPGIWPATTRMSQRGYRQAREWAIAHATQHLREKHNGRGTVGYAVIERTGDWAVFEMEVTDVTAKPRNVRHTRRSI